MAPDGSIISQGSYWSAEAEIGNLEHCLTTDLLNHLVFVQKVNKTQSSKGGLIDSMSACGPRDLKSNPAQGKLV